MDKRELGNNMGISDLNICNIDYRYVERNEKESEKKNNYIKSFVDETVRSR